MKMLFRMKGLLNAAAVMTLASVMVACGGGAGSHAESLPALRAPVATTAAASELPAVDALVALDWAAGAFPQFFTGASSDGYAGVAGFGTFFYRYWPSTGNYVGILGDSAYTYGPMTGNKVQRVGTLSSFACTVYNCAEGAPPVWAGFGRDAQHSAVSGIATQDLNRISWSTPVDLAPQYTSSGELLIHYGSPVITANNTVIVPVKTSALGSFRIEARAGSNGALLWSADTDYALPAHRWTPSYNLALTRQGHLLAPGAGGKLLRRNSPDNASGSLQSLVFYGQATYDAEPAAFNQSVYINTPVTTDANGNIFFGFTATGSNPAGLTSGLARIGADGQGSWVAASVAANDEGIVQVATNSGPAVSPDLSTVYVAVNSPQVQGVVQRGYLVALDSTTFAVKARVALTDPSTGAPARVSDDSTSSPSIGNDGRVYFGVLESVFGAHNARGWLLQFTPLLASAGAPGGFGWDLTPSVIPASMVPSYTGSSTQLLAVKYNNYDGIGTGDGINRIAIIDPGATQIDPFSGISIMKEVLTIAGPTFEDGDSGPVKEWCINTMAADPLSRSMLVNSEDGVLYRWDLTTNTLSQSIRLTNGLGEAYTPTAIGADGAVYAVSNARLFSIAR